MKHLAKITAAAVSIFLIGFAFVTLSPERDVADAQADIFTTFAPDNDTQKFISSLQSFGFEEPRQYKWNGNDVWFSTTLVEEIPREAAARLQREFVEAGLNDREFLEPQPFAQYLDETFDVEEKPSDERVAYFEHLLGGGMVPIANNDRQFTMIGNSTENGSREIADLIRDWKSGTTENDLSSFVQRMRFVDGTLTAGGTRLTAVWADDQFVPERILNRGEGIDVDTNVPICPGCERVSRMAGEEGRYDTTIVNAGYRQNDTILRFYHTAFQQRGWELSTTSALLANQQVAGNSIAVFNRDDEVLTLSIYKKGQDTLAAITRSIEVVPP